MTSKISEERFIKNGSILLEKLISSWNGRCSPIRSFSAKELEQATNNYDSVNVLGGHGHYKWYKGSIEGRIISIKKWDDSDFDIINNIVTAAQMNQHSNFLKLIGCSIETRIPIAVYEFAENGTLSSHIHISSETPSPQPFSWKNRLRIATEIASAVVYLHTASRRPIIHKDIKSSNVFLDRHNVSKLSGFELSIAIPEGETQVQEKKLSGTWGYMPPEYFSFGDVTEKTDVYSFGVLLMELLSAPKLLNDRSNLATCFRTHVLSDENNRVLDLTILEEACQIDIKQQVQAVSRLALRCTERNVEERPTMLDVARQLLQLKRAKVDHR